MLHDAQGVRAFFATNSSSVNGTLDALASSESWAFYPDASPMRSFYAGDPRAAIVPFLAYQCVLTTFGASCRETTPCLWVCQH